jgi:hypothetical protein
MVDFSDYLTLAEASHLLPGRPHLSTLMRWAFHGVKRIRLKTFVVGGRRYTTPDAIREFIEATTAAANREPPPVRTSRQRERDMAAAEAELAKGSRDAQGSRKSALDRRQPQ